ncbi:MAG TPA: DUF362 domain-containing protein [Candidatus Latescibacteria bacterium]|nr:DUF362 domain-containing protein [Candidatus Latescibacterota bacterium]
MAVVYLARMSPEGRPESVEGKVRRLFDAAGLGECVEPEDIVAVKVHIGERGNKTHVPARYVRPIVDKVKARGGRPFLTDTNTLYKGMRSDAVDHIALAEEHGFSLEGVGAPFIVADGLLGHNEVEVEIDGELHKEVAVADILADVQAIVAASHLTGHPLTGFGGTLKNLGMGFSSRKGKLAQHSKMPPRVDSEKCKGCGTCIRWCPVGAAEVRRNAAFIVEEKCISCGECLAVCRFGAVSFSWDQGSEVLQRRMVEHAWGAVMGKEGKAGYFLFLTSVTKGCDCFGDPGKPLFPDIGVLASQDPVAIDQAGLDLVEQETGKSLSEWAYPQVDPTVQLEHAERIGMGSRDYELVGVA